MVIEDLNSVLPYANTDVNEEHIQQQKAQFKTEMIEKFSMIKIDGMFKVIKKSIKGMSGKKVTYIDPEKFKDSLWHYTVETSCDRNLRMPDVLHYKRLIQSGEQ